MSVGIRIMALGGLLLACLTGLSADEPKNDKAVSSEEIIEALEDFNLLVGDWRGVGQPKRGSQQGAWQETGACVWELTKDSTGMRWKAESGKLWSSALITYSPTEKTYAVVLSLPDESTRSFTGSLNKNKLVVESAADQTGEVQRLTWTVLNENRLTVLQEKRLEKQSFYNRVAEIAFQRQGTRLAASEGTGPECVVTGGKGTIVVSHKGKTYFVCCTGCRDAFNDDPEKILAAYEARKKEKK